LQRGPDFVANKRSTPRGAASAPKPAAARGEPARAPGLRATLLEALGALAAAPIIGILAGFLLLFGGVFLAIAWTTGPERLFDSYRYAAFGARTSGRIVESWAAIEFDPADVPEGKLYWQPVSRISPCAVVEFDGDWETPARRAFCGNRFEFSENFRLDDWRTLAPEVPFAFARDASGFAVEEVRMSAAALNWISTHAPRSTFMLSKPPPTTALGALEQQFDRPLDVAVASWTTPVPAFALAFDPAHPDSPLPAKLVEQRQSGFWWGSLLFTLVLAVPGIAVWRVGIGLLTGQRGALAWLLTLAPLFALPWWSDVLPTLVRRANRNWAEIATAMLDDINRVTRFSASAPEDALLADGERLVWRVQAGRYADTFGRVRFRAPQPLPASPDAALAALREQAAADVAALDAGARARLFTRLREQYDAFARDVQPVFTAAAEATLRDPAVDAGTRRAARDFLVYGSGGSYYEDQLDALERSARRP
jgi:hypothetical protein